MGGRGRRGQACGCVSEQARPSRLPTGVSSSETLGFDVRGSTMQAATRLARAELSASPEGRGPAEGGPPWFVPPAASSDGLRGGCAEADARESCAAHMYGRNGRMKLTNHQPTDHRTGWLAGWLRKISWVGWGGG